MYSDHILFVVCQSMFKFDIFGFFSLDIEFKASFPSHTRRQVVDASNLDFQTRNVKKKLSIVTHLSDVVQVE